MIVQQMLIKYQKASFDMMTPGGYVFLTPEAAKELLSGKSVTGHPGVSESSKIITADELLNQKVIQSSYSNNVWCILSDFSQREQKFSSFEQGGEAM